MDGGTETGSTTYAGRVTATSLLVLAERQRRL